MGIEFVDNFFLKTIDVSNKRVKNVTVKKTTGVTFRDKRGRKEPTKEIPPERVAIVEEHIKSFP